MTQIDTTNTDKARVLLDEALQLLREDRSLREVAKQTGGRELSHAITLIEDGCMNMIRSLFADKPYTPLQRLQPVPPASDAKPLLRKVTAPAA